MDLLMNGDWRATHEFQTKVKSRQRFIYITGKTVSAVPKLPTYGNSSEWEEKCVPLKRLLRSGSRGNDDQIFRDGHHITLQERLYQRFLSFLHIIIHLNGKRNVFH